MTKPFNVHLQRAVLPEVLLAPDVSQLMGGVTDSAARRAILRGAFGPYVRIGRRLAVLRSSLLSHLQASAVAAEPPGGAS